MWLSLNYVPLLYMFRSGFMKHRIKVVRFSSFLLLSVVLCACVCFLDHAPKIPNTMRNGMVKATTNRDRKESRANILRHKDGERTKNEYVMFVSYKYQQCSDVYL